MRSQAMESFKLIIAVIIGLIILFVTIALTYMHRPGITLGVPKQVINHSFSWGE
ncbi:MAG: hypothetical protein GXO42_01565 [bacterium]|nr:hypothetical protein [bacterium]